MEVTGTTGTFRVRVEREDGDFVAYVSDEHGNDLGSTYARSLRKLDQCVREVAVLGADLPDDAMPGLTLQWQYTDEALAEAAGVASELAELRAREATSVEHLHAAIRRLSGSGYSTRDVAAVTGVSHARVAQVLTSH